MHADYTIYVGAREDSYDFELGAGVDLSSVSVARIARPAGHFNSFTFLPYAFAGMNTQVTKESNLLARVTLGNRYSAKPGYDLGGNSVYTKMFEDEAYYLGRFFYKSAADLEYSYRINTLLATYARLSLGHQMPLTIRGGRFYATLAVGVMF